MLKIRRPLGRLIFNMGIAIPGKTVFLIETAPWSLYWNVSRSLALPVIFLHNIVHHIDGLVQDCSYLHCWRTGVTAVLHYAIDMYIVRCFLWVPVKQASYPCVEQWCQQQNNFLQYNPAHKEFDVTPPPSKKKKNTKKKTQPKTKNQNKTVHVQIDW